VISILSMRALLLAGWHVGRHGGAPINILKRAVRVSGVLLLAVGAVLVLASFVPYLFATRRR
jgi:hypothetical protein